MYRNTGTVRNTGSSEIRAPQSGTTNWDVNWIRSLQSCSIIGRASALLAGACDQDVGHEGHGHAEADQHRDPGVVDGQRVDDVREDPVEPGNEEEHDPDEGRATRGHGVSPSALQQ